ncbi:MAG: hypothetical protein HZB81_08095 [Deltaproteobacteria bacterium]|nr:hypothetical protein [Deltaproteobacteria bacterium]
MPQKANVLKILSPTKGISFSLPTSCSVFLILVFLILSACAKQISEEDKLKAIVNETAEAAQKKDIGEIRKHISKSYKDADGNDYDAVRRILAYHFIRAETVSIFVRNVDVEIKGDTALVRANVILVRGKEVKSISDIIPESAAGYRFEMIFKKEGRDWKTVSGTWQDVGAAGLL